MWQKHQPVVLKLLLKPGISQFCSHCIDWSVFHAEPSYHARKNTPSKERQRKDMEFVGMDKPLREKGANI